MTSKKLSEKEDPHLLMQPCFSCPEKSVVLSTQKWYALRMDDVPAEERRHVCCITSLLSELTLQMSLYTVCTTCCNNQKLCIFSTHCIYVPLIILTINNHYSLIQHSVICPSNGHCVLCEV